VKEYSYTKVKKEDRVIKPKKANYGNKKAYNKKIDSERKRDKSQSKSKPKTNNASKDLKKKSVL